MNEFGLVLSMRVQVYIEAEDCGCLISSNLTLELSQKTLLLSMAVHERDVDAGLDE